MAFRMRLRWVGNTLVVLSYGMGGTPERQSPLAFWTISSATAFGTSE